uniref:Uncharacterized protein n=1 Tax=viral metagenome TaxID=1070528 RepID=A0A6M3JXA0_9ZZZZ
MIIVTISKKHFKKGSSVNEFCKIERNHYRFCLTDIDADDNYDYGEDRKLLSDKDYLFVSFDSDDQKSMMDCSVLDFLNMEDEEDLREDLREYGEGEYKLLYHWEDDSCFEGIKEEILIIDGLERINHDT